MVNEPFLASMSELPAHPRPSASPVERRAVPIANKEGQRKR
jgi:hypothetical protein